MKYLDSTVQLPRDAGGIIAEEAGARITDFAGGPFSIFREEILASNGRIHAEMEAVLKVTAGV